MASSLKYNKGTGMKYIKLFEGFLNEINLDDLERRINRLKNQSYRPSDYNDAVIWQAIRDRKAPTVIDGNYAVPTDYHAKMRYFDLFENLNEADKFTFKTTKPAGRYRSFFKSSHDIKLKGFEVGSIGPEKPFKIRFMVIKNGTTIKDDNPNCPWKWITLKKESETLDAAKEWLNANIEAIMKQWPLRTSEK